MNALGVFALLSTVALGAVTQPEAPSQRVARPTAVIHHQVSENPKAQAAFDRGLLDYYAYNPEAAEHEFYTAADLDPHAAMAYWGIALSNAPNLNIPSSDDRARRAAYAIDRATKLEGYSSTEDRAFIDAAAARFGSDAKGTPDALLLAYRNALQHIEEAYPTDPDAAALYAEAALYVADGDIWPVSDNERIAFANRVRDILPVFQAGLAKFPKHVGLLHFYIHACQQANVSENAVAAARQLAAFEFPIEDSHLTHMPGHTFYDVGLYAEALDVGQRSVAMDDADFACCHPGFYSAPRYYREHDVEFLLYGMTQTGRIAESVDVARRDGSEIDLAKQLVAAQRWQDVVALPYVKGKDQTLGFIRALSFAKLGDFASAQDALTNIPNAPQDAPWRVAIVSEMRSTAAAAIAEALHDDDKAMQLLVDAATANAKAGPGEFPVLYYYSPHMALAAVATRLGKTDVARAALQAELADSPRSIAALAALARLPAP